MKRRSFLRWLLTAIGFGAAAPLWPRRTAPIWIDEQLPSCTTFIPAPLADGKGWMFWTSTRGKVDFDVSAARVSERRKRID